MAYTRQGGERCVELTECLSDRGYQCKGYLFHKYNDIRFEKAQLEAFVDAEEIIGAAFVRKCAVIFICAVGIAVRKISGFVKSKLTDSPVVVIDDMGKFCIPLLSGHLGGANLLAEICAEITGGIPVITTATDLHGRFAVDVFAKNNGLFITDMRKAKQVSANLLEGKKIYLYVENVCLKNNPSDNAVIITDDREKAEDGGIVISAKRYGEYRHDEYRHDDICHENSSALQLIPKQITLGIGCRRGTPKERIASAVSQVLSEHKIAFQSVKKICSINLKQTEKGLTDFCKENGLPFQTFDSDTLMNVSGTFHRSEFVGSVTGADNVCERSAVAGSSGTLLIKKTIKDHITVAAALNVVDLWFA